MNLVIHLVILGSKISLHKICKSDLAVVQSAFAIGNRI